MRDSTGVFFSGGDQSRILALVGSRANDILREQLGRGLVVAGTSAGATAMGRTMILGGEGPEVSAATVRTGPGLGLLPRLLIDMHFAERGRLPRLLSAVALDPDHLGVGIDENTAILVDGDTFEVLGTGVATVADGERSTVVHAAGDCDPITLFDVRLHLMPAGCVFDIAARTPGHRARPQPLLSSLLGPLMAAGQPDTTPPPRNRPREHPCASSTATACPARTSTRPGRSPWPGWSWTG